MAEKVDVDERAPLVGIKAPETKGVSYRHRLMLLASFGFFVVYALRVNLSVAVVKMQDEYNWSSNEKGLVLASFFYGYIITQIPGGYLAARFGAKHVYGFGVLTTTVLTLITPLVAPKFSVLIFLRVVEGFGEGVTYPAMHAMWGRWAPPLERTKLVSFTYSGSFLGTVCALPVSGALAGSSFLKGWPSVFYVFGILGLFWYVLWILFVFNTPEEHPHISPEERDYIVKSIEAGRTDDSIKQPPTPWLAIFSSGPVWAIIILHFCNNWGFYTLLTCLPSYFNDVLRFDITDSGWKSGLPYLCLFLVAVSVGQLADYIRTRKILRTVIVRKLCNLIAFVFASLFLVLAGFVHKSESYLAVVYLCLALGFLGFGMSGFNVNHLDIGPRFGGVLMGITNCGATIPGFLGPTVAGIIAKCQLCDKDEYKDMYFEGPDKCPTAANIDKFTPCDAATARNQWRLVFYISAGIFMFGLVSFLILGSGTVQPWNDPDYNKEKQRQKKEASIQ